MTAAEVKAADEAARFYDGAPNNFDLAMDPRCLWGWGPPTKGCAHRFGHSCFRTFGHPGECWDAGGPLEPVKYRVGCETMRRPKDWDTEGRAEANQ